MSLPPPVTTRPERPGDRRPGRPLPGRVDSWPECARSAPAADRRRQMNPLAYPAAPLSDGALAVRPWAESDVDCVRLASLDPMIPPGTTVPREFTVERGVAFIHRQWSRAADGVGVSQAIADAASGRAIGLVIV